MEISCVICYNNMSSTDVLYGTFCGHVFHAECVTDWMQRSATCPQCRCPVRCQDIRRIYLNFANSENSLIGNIMTNHESELEKLKMIDEKKTETITTLTDHIKKKDLEEVQHVKTIQQLHVEIQVVRRHLAEEKAKFSKEKVEMHKRISELEKMNKSAAWQTVAQMFPATDDPATLVQKIAGMKRELTLTAEKCNKLEESVAHFSKRFLDECEKNSELEKRLEICGREKLELEARIAKDKENVKPGKNLNAPKVDKDASESTIKKPKLAARTADGKSNVKYKRKLVKAEDEQNAAKSNTKSPRYNLRPR